MGLVRDINGVGKVLGTLEMTANPTNPASTRIARLANSWSYIGISALAFCTARGAGDARGRADLVLKIAREGTILDQQLEQRGEVLGVQLAVVLVHCRGPVQRRAGG